MISAIAAVRTFDFAIGYKNGLLHKDSGDMQLFRKLTKEAGVVVMGYNTAMSLKKPLPGRRNIVVTSRGKLEGFETTTFNNLPWITLKYKGIPDNELFIIGGGMLYNSTIDIVDKFYLTTIGIPGGSLYKAVNAKPADAYMNRDLITPSRFQLESSTVSHTHAEVLFHEYTRRVE